MLQRRGPRLVVALHLVHNLRRRQRGLGRARTCGQAEAAIRKTAAAAKKCRLQGKNMPDDTPVPNSPATPARSCPPCSSSIPGYPVTNSMIRRLRFSVLTCGFLAALLIPLHSAAQEDASHVLPYRDEKPVRASHGMVVSVQHLASDAGLEVLREGGNAVDAAVATGFALAVVHPAAGNLGGGGFLLLRTHDGKATFIDFREKAPLKATETMYQDAKGQLTPDDQARTGAPEKILRRRHGPVSSATAP